MLLVEVKGNELYNVISQKAQISWLKLLSIINTHREESGLGHEKY